MNRKQKFCMWLGIIAVCLSNLGFMFYSIGTIVVFYDFCFWFIWIFGIALVTGGLIVTFADQKDKKPKEEQNKK